MKKKLMLIFVVAILLCLPFKIKALSTLNESDKKAGIILVQNDINDNNGVTPGTTNNNTGTNPNGTIPGTTNNGTTPGTTNDTTPGTNDTNNNDILNNDDNDNEGALDNDDINTTTDNDDNDNGNVFTRNIVPGFVGAALGSGITFFALAGNRRNTRTHV